MRYLSELEIKIVLAIFSGAEKNGAKLWSLEDGGAWSVLLAPLDKERDEISEAEENTICFFDATSNLLGSVYLIPGNEHDIITDYSDNEWTETILKEALEISDSE